MEMSGSDLVFWARPILKAQSIFSWKYKPNQGEAEQNLCIWIFKELLRTLWKMQVCPFRFETLVLFLFLSPILYNFLKIKLSLAEIWE